MKAKQYHTIKNKIHVYKNRIKYTVFDTTSSWAERWKSSITLCLKPNGVFDSLH